MPVDCARRDCDWHAVGRSDGMKSELPEHSGDRRPPQPRCLVDPAARPARRSTSQSGRDRRGGADRGGLAVGAVLPGSAHHADPGGARGGRSAGSQAGCRRRRRVSGPGSVGGAGLSRRHWAVPAVLARARPAATWSGFLPAALLMGLLAHRRTPSGPRRVAPSGRSGLLAAGALSGRDAPSTPWGCPGSPSCTRAEASAGRSPSALSPIFSAICSRRQWPSGPFVRALVLSAAGGRYPSR